MPPGSDAMEVRVLIVAYHTANGRWVGEFFTDERAARQRFDQTPMAEDLWEVPVVVDLDRGRILEQRRSKVTTRDSNG
jgi:hypothetical protein